MSLETLIEEVKKLPDAEREKLLLAVRNFNFNPSNKTVEPDVISKLIEKPLQMSGFRPLTRDEANTR